MRWFLTILVAGLLLACEKDPAVPVAEGPPSLFTWLAGFPAKAVSHRAVAHAGNHPAFERETDAFPVHILFHAPRSAHSFVYFESDSTQYPDSLQYYRQKALDFELMQNGLLGRFLRTQPKRNVLARIGYQLGDSVFVSGAVMIRGQAATPTASIVTVNVKVSETGRASFNWLGLDPFAVSYLVLLEDRTGEAFCGVYTNSRSFMFYDLRNVTHNLTPELYDPLLVAGEEYTIGVYAMDEQGWIRNFRRIQFVATTEVGT